MKWKRVYSNCKLLSAYSEVNFSPSPQPSTDAPDTGNHVGEEKMEDEESSMYYIPVALGLLTLAAVVLVMFSLLHRCVRHYKGGVEVLKLELDVLVAIV